MTLVNLIAETSLSPVRVSKVLARHPIPVFLVARLAIDNKSKGQHLGSRLFRRALLHAAEISDQVPIRAINVDAIDDGAQKSYSRFDFEAFLADGLRMWLLLKDLIKTQQTMKLQK